MRTKNFSDVYRSEGYPVTALIDPKPRIVKNDLGEPIAVGMVVGRLDNYKRNGKVMAVNTSRGGQPVLVRWPNLDDEWMNPGILRPIPDAVMPTQVSRV